MKNRFLFVFAIITLFASCTVVKRVHQPGYYVSWHKQHQSIPNSEEESEMEKTDEIMDNETSNQVTDQLLLDTGFAPIEKVLDELVKDIPNGVNISSVRTTTKDFSVKASTHYSSHANRVIKITKPKDVEDTSSSEGGKSQLVALILAILLGGIGIHRFYLGHIGMGILYLFTAGLCGIGWLIDIIMIATGSLKPKDSSYEDTL
jgi:hypothetical protein